MRSQQRPLRQGALPLFPPPPYVRPRALNPQPAQLGITGFPTWVIRGKQHRGYHRLEDMAVIAEAKEAATQL